jgi:hypothetical protein
MGLSIIADISLLSRLHPAAEAFSEWVQLALR